MYLHCYQNSSIGKWGSQLGSQLISNPAQIMNDKDLTNNISNKNINHKFPVYAQNYIKQYICLLGLNDNFGHIHRYLA